MEKGFIVIGTDTGIGKTYVSSLLFKGLKDKEGFYYKPIQSGCFNYKGNIIAPDVQFVCDKNKINYDKEMVTYTLEEEVSPHLALEKQHLNFDLNNILEHFNKLKKRYKYLIVEGAGGLYVPISRNKMYMFDLIKHLDLPVILVCSSRVGTINHTMLTIEALNHRNIKLHGIIFNGVSKDLEKDYYEKDNIDTILKESGVKNLLIINKNDTIIDCEKLKKFLGI